MKYLGTLSDINRRPSNLNDTQTAILEDNKRIKHNTVTLGIEPF
jgi:hypothetical protein